MEINISIDNKNLKEWKLKKHICIILPITTSNNKIFNNLEEINEKTKKKKERRNILKRQKKIKIVENYLHNIT